MPRIEYEVEGGFHKILASLSAAPSDRISSLKDKAHDFNFEKLPLLSPMLSEIECLLHPLRMHNLEERGALRPPAERHAIAVSFGHCAQLKHGDALRQELGKLLSYFRMPTFCAGA